MRHSGLFLASAILLLGSESCILSEKNVEVPLRGNTDLQFTTVGPGGTDLSATTSIDMFEEFQNVEEEGGDVLEVVDVAVESAYWRVVENRLSASPTTVLVSVLVWRIGVPPDTLVPEVSVLLSQAGTEFHALPLDPAGLGQILQGMDEYVAFRNQGGPAPDLNYHFQLNAAATNALDMDWGARFKFTLIGRFTVDVPDLWD